MVIDFGKLPSIRSKHPGKKIVLAGGCFDILHPGHLWFFKHAKVAKSILVVGVTSDQRVRERKGRGRPIFSETKRARMVDSIKGVDYVVIMPTTKVNGLGTTEQTINELKPDFFATSDSKWEGVDSVGETIIRFLPESSKKRHSTSNILNKILNCSF